MEFDLYQHYENRDIILGTSPAALHLESVRGCPFDCAMCEFGNTKTQDISMDLLKKIEPYYDGLEILSIHGEGEPLLSNHLNYFVENSVKHKFVIHMNTNGVLLSKERATILSKAYGLSIRFSIHAGKEDTYKKITGCDFNVSIKKIKHLIDLSNYKSYNHDFWFSYIVMKENLDEIEDFLKVANGCGITSVRFMRLNPTIHIMKGVEKRDFKLNYYEQFNKIVIDEFVKNIPRYSKLASDLGIKIEYGSMNHFKKYSLNPVGDFANRVTNKFFNKKAFPIIPKKGTCIVPWYGQLRITVEGNVSLCANSSDYLGNLYENTLQEIWNSKKIKQVRKAFSHGYYHKLCGYCKGLDINDYPNNSFVKLRKIKDEFSLS